MKQTAVNEASGEVRHAPRDAVLDGGTTLLRGYGQ